MEIKKLSPIFQVERAFFFRNIVKKSILNFEKEGEEMKRLSQSPPRKDALRFAKRKSILQVKARD
jgi:hypothetical protein